MQLLIEDKFDINIQRWEGNFMQKKLEPDLVQIVNLKYILPNYI